MERTYATDAKPGKKIILKGWVERTRDLGNLKFFTFRDKTGTIQVTAKKGVVPDILMNHVSELLREDCISVAGTVKESKQAPGGLEVIPSEITMVGKSATPLPYEKGVSGKDKRFSYRFLDLRDPNIQAIFKIKDALFAGVRDAFSTNGFTEVHTPAIQAAGAEGGATMFPVIYYQKEAFLRQSPQLYKQILMASGLDRIWEIGASFRAEEFHTRKHVSEFQMIDLEMAWIDSEEDVMKFIETMVVHSLNHVAKTCKEELNLLDVKFNVPNTPFERITYDEVIKLISKNAEVKWGDDLGDSEERILGEILGKKGIEWYWITKYPSEIKPFYVYMDGKYSRGFDLGYKGIEVSSGGQREHRYNVLVKMMKSKGLDPEKFTFYLDAFKYGCPSHGGAGIGVERIVQQMLNLSDIKEAILFPRTPERLVP